MRIYRHFNDLPASEKGAAVAVGNFDGVHRGHQTVIGEAGRVAKSNAMPWGVLTFEPHPRSVFDPAAAPLRLTPFRVKTRHIEAMGVDFLVVQHFDLDFSKWPAETFVERVLVGGLAARHVVSGYDFVFGHGRKGNAEMLLSLGARDGFGYTCVQPVRDADGTVFSSTRVRDFLRAGDPQGAARVLGRHFEIEGRVQTGDARGRTIGFPTANLSVEEYVCPATGVYAVRAGIDEAGNTVWHDGVANLGSRPTFGGNQVRLEAHLFGFSGDLYGAHLRVALIDRLRPEKKFDGLDALKAQITEDCARARHVLAQY